ncbi:hypothetical protein BKA70DRAFT_1099361 [Coprinopsis sp. MPI-PUGE-AT-0042]|nr:hypothetical protein BKA70DRAFT_1099361 [Coprinopsis sp. MPI-PUGE-AT-0042]
MLKIGRFPSPPSPAGGWPLAWVPQVLKFSEDDMHKLRGVDATLYVRFLRGCFWWALLHTLTTFPILFPIHVQFSDEEVPPKSMTRASISSLVATEKGLSLLWIHMCLLFWITLTWMATLVWICNGAFRLRAKSIQQLAARRKAYLDNPEDFHQSYHQHPHPQYAFHDVPTPDQGHPNLGLRLRTIMVSNVPSALREEKVLKEYFEYWLSRKIEKPGVGITSSTQPGFLNKSFAFIFNRAKRIPAHLPDMLSPKPDENPEREVKPSSSRNSIQPPVIERVVVAKKMTELASLLARREELLRLLETAHINLASKALAAAKEAMSRKEGQKPVQAAASSRAAVIARNRRSQAAPDLERGDVDAEVDDEGHLDKLVEALGPFVKELEAEAPKPIPVKSRKRFSTQSFKQLMTHSPPGSPNMSESEDHKKYPPRSGGKRRSNSNEHGTVWDALLSLPRDVLDPYQPLVSLNQLFRGKPVPAIDYYTAKLNLLTSLITENRSKPVGDFDSASTAFVTFADPSDARRACKYLAVHPNNPLACTVTMAPEYQDIDWIRVMKSSFRGEFLKDWIVDIGVWGFTIFWLFPVSLLVGLVSIQNISLFWPQLKQYLDRHPWQSEVIQSFIPTLLVALLAILIPLILLLIAKKAHTITTLSALHDLIMTRYYKFLIVNVLVFFCVGTAAMQSVLESVKNITGAGLIEIVANSFPTAGPFYVGWLIFTTAMHGGFELMLLGLPLLTYPGTKGQATPRKRTVGIRPRTLNYYYWLPNHLLVLHVLLLFCAVNPFVLPFGAFYFFIQSGVIKNQLIHVYAKHYEGNGKTLLIRMVRYSLDGLTLSMVVFTAYMVVLHKKANIGVCVFLLVFTVMFKLLITRMCRAQFELDDMAEAEALCGHSPSESMDAEVNPEEPDNGTARDTTNLIESKDSKPSVLTLKLPRWINFSYDAIQQKPQYRYRRKPIPFEPVPASTPTREHKSRQSNFNSEPDEYPWGGMGRPGNPTIRIDTADGLQIGPVVPHTRRTPWDDQETVDLPYDNPYYSRPFDKVLWLPRNPVGVLNLDDTVDMKVSLTVELSAGQIGTWLGLVPRSSPEEICSSDGETPSHTHPVSPPLSLTSLPEVTGNEEIALPRTIRRRLQSGENVEQVVKPRRSTMSSKRQVSGSDTLHPSGHRTTKRRPSVLEIPMHHSASQDGTSPPTGRGRSSSILSILSPPVHRTTSADHEFGVRPDAHAQADLVASVASNGSKMSLAPKTPHITAQEAIFHEILAEEEQALITRLEEEEAESIKSKSSKSWLTSWMFKRGE